MAQPAFLASDWGTTNLRAWLMADDGRQGAGVSGAEPGDPVADGAGDRALLDVEGERAGSVAGQGLGGDAGLGSLF